MIIDERSGTKRLDRFSALASGPITLAVSGGGDSVAMLLHVYDWAKTNNRKLIVLTVDHGLRTEAKQETDWVLNRAQALGLPCEVLKVENPNPSQNKSRVVRHQLIAKTMRKLDSKILMLGHTLDDQVETVAMRERKKSFQRGLAGMAWISPSPVWPEGRGLFLVRPLLKSKRGDLRDRLLDVGESWINDPSNDNVAYERIAWRKKIEKSPKKFNELKQLQLRGEFIKRAEDLEVSKWITESVITSTDGTIIAPFRELHKAVWRPAVQLLLQVVAGHANPVAGKRMENIVFALNGKYFRPRTLGGTFLMRPNLETTVTRDPGAEMSDIDGVWDGRFERQPDAPIIVPTNRRVAKTLPRDYEQGGWKSIASDRLQHWQKIVEENEAICRI